MGYTLRAFIGRTADVQTLANQWHGAITVAIGQNLSILPMVDELYDELNDFAHSEVIAPFIFLTAQVEAKALALIGPVCLGYVEANYFGGTGTQTAIWWQAGEQGWRSTATAGAINTLLRQLGVTTGFGRDEFDTLRLSRHRHTEDWALS